MAHKQEKVTKINGTKITQTITSGNADDADVYFANRIAENRKIRNENRKQKITTWLSFILLVLLMLMAIIAAKKSMGKGSKEKEHKVATDYGNDNIWYYYMF